MIGLNGRGKPPEACSANKNVELAVFWPLSLLQKCFEVLMRCCLPPFLRTDR